MKPLLALSLPALALSAPLLADRDAAAPPSFKINKVISGGSGCPQGSIDVDWTNNGILPICTSSPPSLSSHLSLSPQEEIDVPNSLPSKKKKKKSI